MKKIQIFLWVMFIGTMAFGQSSYFSGLKNEVKINAPYALAGFLDLSYERILSEDTGVGASIVLPLDSDYRLNYFILPYARAYFGQKEAAGFFAEVHAAVYSTEETDNDLNLLDDNDEDENVDLDDYTGLGIGFSLGYKLFSKSHWAFEAVAGLGRNFQNDDKIGSAYPRFGLNLGRRF